MNRLCPYLIFAVLLILVAACLILAKAVYADVPPENCYNWPCC